MKVGSPDVIINSNVWSHQPVKWSEGNFYVLVFTYERNVPRLDVISRIKSQQYDYCVDIQLKELLVWSSAEHDTNINRF